MVSHQCLYLTKRNYDNSVIFLFVYYCVCVCAESCPALCNSVDDSLLGSSVHGIFQARILDWLAISYSRVSSQPRDQMMIINSRECCKRVGQWTYWCLSSTIQRRELTCCTQMVLVACILVYIMGWVPWKKRLWDEEEQTGTFQKQDWAEGEVELWYISAEVPANFLESSEPGTILESCPEGNQGPGQYTSTLINCQILAIPGRRYDLGWDSSLQQRQVYTGVWELRASGFSTCRGWE